MKKALAICILLLCVATVYAWQQSGAYTSNAQQRSQSLLNRAPTTAGLPQLPLTSTGAVADAQEFVRKMIFETLTIEVSKQNLLNARYESRFVAIETWLNSHGYANDAISMRQEIDHHFAAVGILDQELQSKKQLYANAYYLIHNSEFQADYELGVSALEELFTWCLQILAHTIVDGKIVWMNPTIQELYAQVEDVDRLLDELERKCWNYTDEWEAALLLEGG